MSEEYDGKEFYLNQDLLPSTEEKLLELTALRKKGPETCLKSMRLGQEAILEHLTEADIDLNTSKFSANNDTVKNVDSHAMNLLHNLTDQLKNSDGKKPYDVVSDYKNVLKFISNQKNEN